MMHIFLCPNPQEIFSCLSSIQLHGTVRGHFLEFAEMIPLVSCCPTADTHLPSLLFFHSMSAESGICKFYLFFDLFSKTAILEKEIATADLTIDNKDCYQIAVVARYCQNDSRNAAIILQPQF